MRTPTVATASPVSTDGDDPAGLRDLIDRVQSRDMAALGELYSSFGAACYRSALRLTGNQPDAEDVTQEVFVRLPGALRGFTGSTANFPGWIRRVAVRQALMSLRSGRRRREVSVDGVASLVAPAEAATERMTIHAAVARLPEAHRTVFLLKEVEGYDHAEIAEALGISISNSEVRLHRARRELRDMLRGSR